MDNRIMLGSIVTWSVQSLSWLMLPIFCDPWFQDPMTFTQSHGCIISVDQAFEKYIFAKKIQIWIKDCQTWTYDEGVFCNLMLLWSKNPWRWYVRRLFGLEFGSGTYYPLSFLRNIFPDWKNNSVLASQIVIFFAIERTLEQQWHWYGSSQNLICKESSVLSFQH